MNAPVLSRSLRRVALSVLFCAASASAQEFPTKPVRLVIANSAGTIGDLVARAILPDMTKTLGQPVIVENKPGGAGVIGYQYVVNQNPADGYTVAVGESITLASLPLAVKDVGFDVIKDLPPFISLGETSFVFGSAAQFPWKSLAELVAAAKAAPGKYNFGSGALSSRLPTEMLLNSLGIKVTFVPFGGGAQYLQGLASGQVEMGFTVVQAVAGWGDKFRALAVTGDKRSLIFKDTPTFKELGVKSVQDLTLEYWLNAKAGTPKPVIDKLTAAAAAALRTPEVRGQFEKLGMEVTGRSGEVSQRRLAEQARGFAAIGKELNIQPQ